MSMKHALLGFLSYKPMTGYELKQAFDTTVHFFWNAELSQIYPALKSMEREGLLSMHVEPQQDRPNRKVYEMTELGQEALEEWMQEPTELPSTKDAFLIKIFFGAAIDPDITRRNLEDQLRQHRAQLHYWETSTFESLRDVMERSPHLRDPNYWVLTLEWAIRHERTCIEWCEWALDRFEVMARDAGSALEAAGSRAPA